VDNKPKVLLAGESWMSLGTHIKGFNEFPTGFYEEGHNTLTTALREEFEVDYLPGHLSATEFPETLEVLSQYQVVLFSDIGADTLLLHPDTFLRFLPRPNRLLLIQQFVKQGGGFGMIGGYMSFAGIGGRAHYHRTPIEEILPVSILPYDDRVETPQGISPEVINANHPILSEVQGEWPILLGYNRLEMKPEGEVLLQHQQDPLLSVRSYGMGRTMAFASDCAPHWGSVQFTEWSQYPVFWRALVRWLAG
jgi:uncharacterized membrane protein